MDYIPGSPLDPSAGLLGHSSPYGDLSAWTHFGHMSEAEYRHLKNMDKHETARKKGSRCPACDAAEEKKQRAEYLNAAGGCGLGVAGGTIAGSAGLNPASMALGAAGGGVAAGKDCWTFISTPTPGQVVPVW